MTAHARSALFACLALLLPPLGICAQAARTDEGAARCQALATVDFTQIQDAPTQVAEVDVVAARADDPAYCRVRGYAWPQVGFELRLPLDHWNGKFFEAGCGGACGDTGWMLRVPGMPHCTSGDGAFAIDYVSYLEDWVERNHAPEKLLGAHVDRHYLEQQADVDGKPTDPWTAALALHFPLNRVPVTFTRPVFPFPTLAKYKGTGDPNDAANFRPAAPPRENAEVVQSPR